MLLRIAAKEELEALIMVAYEFCWVDKRGGSHFFAILPERRRNPERISDLLQSSDVSLGLSREEGRVCTVLLEIGEADAETIAEGAGIPTSKMDALLSELEKRGMIASLPHTPGMFALARLSNE